MIICCTDEKERRLILDHVSDIEAQCRAGSIEIVSAIESEKGMLVGTMTKSCKGKDNPTIHIPMGVLKPLNVCIPSAPAAAL